MSANWLNSVTMKSKRVISSLMLAIYLMASCGSMLSVILCHCTRSSHFQAHHSCSDHHTCNHSTHKQGEGIVLPSNCGCNHDHSTEIDLYNYKEYPIIDCTPIVCTALIAMQEQIPLSLDNTKIKYLDRRKIPLYSSDIVALKGLRAPPAIA